jgi:predicted dehydrogenase
MRRSARERCALGRADHSPGSPRTGSSRPCRARNAVASAISSPNGKAAEVAESFGIPAVYGTHEELLADPSIEAVYLPFPNGLHAEWIIAAAEAGKDILCEKPLVGTLDDYSAVLEACERNNVTLMEAFMYRFHPQHQKVREFIDSGRIGQIVSMHARFHFVMNRTPGEVRLQTGLEGGALNDVGCYAVDIMNMVMGPGAQSVSTRKGDQPDGPGGNNCGRILDYGRRHRHAWTAASKDRAPTPSNSSARGPHHPGPGIRPRPGRSRARQRLPPRRARPNPSTSEKTSSRSKSNGSAPGCETPALSSSTET